METFNRPTNQAEMEAVARGSVGHEITMVLSIKELEHFMSLLDMEQTFLEKHLESCK